MVVRNEPKRNFRSWVMLMKPYQTPKRKGSTIYMVMRVIMIIVIKITLILLTIMIIDTKIEKRNMMPDEANFEKSMKEKTKNEKKNETKKIKKGMLND